MNRNNFLKKLTLGALSIPFLGFKSETVRKNKVIEFTPEILNKYNYGLYLINDKADVVKNPDYAATVSWKLTWNSGVIVNNIDNKKIVSESWCKYSITNFLTDGWTYPISSKKEEVCEYLNNNPYGHKFRIMTKEEVIYIMTHRSNFKQLFYE